MFLLKSRTALVCFVLTCAVFGVLLFFHVLLTNREPYINLTERSPVAGTAQSSSTDGRALQFAVATMWSVESTFVLYRQLVARIAEDLGRKESLILRPSYTALRRAVEHREIDVAFVGVGSYVHMLPGKHIRLLVEPEFLNGGLYHSVMIVSSKSNLRSLADLRGKTIGFSDSEAFSGYLLPYVMLRDRGIDPDTYFKKIVFTGSNDRSIFAVDRGIVDIAAVHSIVLDSAKRADPSLQGRLREIWASNGYGPPPVVVSTDLPKSFADSLEKAFLNLDKDGEGREILEAIGMKRFVPAWEEDYISAVELYKRYEHMRKAK